MSSFSWMGSWKRSWCLSCSAASGLKFKVFTGTSHLHHHQQDKSASPVTCDLHVDTQETIEMQTSNANGYFAANEEARIGLTLQAYNSITAKHLFFTRQHDGCWLDSTSPRADSCLKGRRDSTPDALHCVAGGELLYYVARPCCDC